MKYIETVNNLKKYKKPKIIPGVYTLFKKDEIVYIGQSWDISIRVIYYASDKCKNIMDWDSYSYITINDRKERLLVEKYLIQEYNPSYNKHWCK